MLPQLLENSKDWRQISRGRSMNCQSWRGNIMSWTWRWHRWESIATAETKILKSGHSMDKKAMRSSCSEKNYQLSRKPRRIRWQSFQKGTIAVFLRVLNHRCLKGTTGRQKLMSMLCTKIWLASTVNNRKNSSRTYSKVRNKGSRNRCSANQSTRRSSSTEGRYKIWEEQRSPRRVMNDRG